MTRVGEEGSRLELVVSGSGERLDRYVAQRCPHTSRSHIQRLIGEGRVTVNGRAARESLRLRDGDRIEALIPPPSPPQPQPQPMPLSIVYEDGDILVVNKPAGLTVHPAAGHPDHTLVNAVLAHCPQLAAGGAARPGIVHRLDRDTSGLMVVAKNEAAYQHLTRQWRARSVLKRYTVLVFGRLSPRSGTIEAPIGRDPGQRKRMAVVSEGREARTHYRVVEYIDSYSLLEVTLETGRTHQIRVHLSAIGFPVVGDGVYGRKSPLVARQFIHACCLGLRLPSSDEWVEFSAGLPPDLAQSLERITAEP